MRKKALKNKTLFTLLLFSALILPLLFIFSCGEVPERERSTAPIHEHTFGEWIVAKEPTCTDEGFRERVCACGEKESEAIPALGHTPGEAVTKSGKAADCAEDGWHYTVVYCSICNAEILRETTVIPPLGHDYNESVCTRCLAHAPSDGLEYELDSDGKSYIVAGMGTCAESVVYIAKTYNGKPVASIGPEAFINQQKIKEIIIPSSVTSIGNYAFYGCNGLISITVEDGNAVYHSAGNCVIETATETVVAGCKTSVIPKDGSVTAIGDYAFSGINNLTSITIPESITSIGKGAFFNCTRLYKVINESDVVLTLNKTDNRYATYYAKILIDKYGNRTVADKSTDLYDYIETEDGFLFLLEKGTYRLLAYFGNETTVRLPETINGSYYHIDYFCTSGICELIIPNGFIEIDVYAFKDFAGLVSVTIPSSVMRIGRCAFIGCANLETTFYTGSEEQWELVSVYKYNDELIKSKIICSGDYPSSPLDRFNGRYGYYYLGTLEKGEKLQRLYNRIDAYVKLFHTDSRISADPYGNDQYLAFEVRWDDLDLTALDARSVFVTYTNDNPLFYWIKGASVIVNDLCVLCVEEYADGNTRTAFNEYMYGIIERFIDRSNGKSGSYSIALLFHDLIISATDYGYDENEPGSAAKAHSIIGVLSGKGSVCEGYAKTYQLLLNLKGVENIYVTGPASSVRHAWNLVRLDDGNWYWVDVTWDDAGGNNGAAHTWFCLSDETFTDHITDTPGSYAYLYELPSRTGASKYAGSV